MDEWVNEDGRRKKDNPPGAVGLGGKGFFVFVMKYFIIFAYKKNVYAGNGLK